MAFKDNYYSERIVEGRTGVSQKLEELLREKKIEVVPLSSSHTCQEYTVMFRENSTGTYLQYKCDMENKGTIDLIVPCQRTRNVFYECKKNLREKLWDVMIPHV